MSTTASKSILYVKCKIYLKIFYIIIIQQQKYTKEVCSLFICVENEAKPFKY